MPPKRKRVPVTSSSSVFSAAVTGALAKLSPKLAKYPGEVESRAPLNLGPRPEASSKADVPSAAPRRLGDGGAPRRPRPERQREMGPFQQVMKGVAAAEMPQMAKDMIDDMLAFSLGVVKDRRDSYQNEVVEMIDGVLAKVDADLQAKLEEVTTLITTDAEKKDEMQSKVQEAEGAVEVKKADVLKRKRELADVARVYKVAKKETDDAEAESRSTDRDSRSKVEHKEELIRLMDDIFAPNEDASKLEELKKRLRTVEVSDSMMAALPTVLAKSHDTRGPFDSMVLTTVKDELAKKVELAEEAIKNAEPARVANAEVLKVAQDKLEEIAVEQETGCDVYTEEREKEEALAREIANLHKEIVKLKRTARNNNWAHAKAKGNLESFQNGPKKAFQDSMEKTTPSLEAKPREAAEEGQAAADA